MTFTSTKPPGLGEATSRPVLAVTGGPGDAVYVLVKGCTEDGGPVDATHIADSELAVAVFEYLQQQPSR